MSDREQWSAFQFGPEHRELLITDGHPHFWLWGDGTDATAVAFDPGAVGGKPFAFRFPNDGGRREELALTDGSPEFWDEFGEDISIITWDADAGGDPE